MYEIYFYPPFGGYNIRRLSDLYTTGHCTTLQECLTRGFIVSNRLIRGAFELTYDCKYLFTVPSLDTLEQDYPELFV